jgi:pimeloyl-ACP methyl ester carboxylesterase
VGVCDRFIAVNGLRLHCREWGQSSARPVVLLHGGSAHAHWWDLFADSIADHYHVYALDLRGHGDSQHASPPAYRIDDYARDLSTFMELLGLPSATLVGHSLGAMIATAYAGTAPRRVQGLVVVDSALKVTPADVRYMARLQRFPQPMYRSRDDALRRLRLLPMHTTADASILRHVAAYGLRQVADGRWTLKFDREAMAQDGPVDLTPHLQRLRCPILFVRGAHSTLLTEAGLAALLRVARHAQAVELPDAHHHVMLDNPTAFERAIRNFLEGRFPNSGYE